MFALFDRFVEICLLRKGPQDLPASAVLLRLVILFYVLSGLLVLMVGRTFADLFSIILLIALDIVILSGLIYAILQVLGFLSRFLQTLTALFGTGTLLQLLILPLAVWMESVGIDSTGVVLPWLLSQLLLIWSLVITGFILQQAFSVSRLAGLLYAFGYMIISLTLGSLLPPTV